VWRNPPSVFFSAQKVADGMREELKRRGLTEPHTKRALERLFRFSVDEATGAS
jgi:hypothetical protein